MMQEEIQDYLDKPFYCEYSKKCKEYIKKHGTKYPNTSAKPSRNQAKNDAAETQDKSKNAKKPPKQIEQKPPITNRRQSTRGKDETKTQAPSAQQQTPKQQSANVEKRKNSNQEAKNQNGANSQAPETNSATPNAAKNQTTSRVEATENVSKNTAQQSKQATQSTNQQQMTTRIQKKEKNVPQVKNNQDQKTTTPAPVNQSQKWANDNSSNTKGPANLQKTNGGQANQNQQLQQLASQTQPQRTLRGHQSNQTKVDVSNLEELVANHQQANNKNCQNQNTSQITKQTANSKEAQTQHAIASAGQSGVNNSNGVIHNDNKDNSRRTTGTRRKEKIVQKENVSTKERTNTGSNKTGNRSQSAATGHFHQNQTDNRQNNHSKANPHQQQHAINEKNHKSSHHAEERQNVVRDTSNNKEGKGKKKNDTTYEHLNHGSKNKRAHESSKRDLNEIQKIQEAESSISQRHNRNNGKDNRKNRNNYIQPGQKPLQPMGIPHQLLGYPPIVSYPMFNMATPNLMMSGGIHNLISNIKSLNIQMAAAIVNAEKMKKLNEQQKQETDYQERSYSAHERNLNQTAGSKRHINSQLSNSSGAYHAKRQRREEQSRINRSFEMPSESGVDVEDERRSQQRYQRFGQNHHIKSQEFIDNRRQYDRRSREQQYFEDQRMLDDHSDSRHHLRKYSNSNEEASYPHQLVESQYFERGAFSNLNKQQQEQQLITFHSQEVKGSEKSEEGGTANRSSKMYNKMIQQEKRRDDQKAYLINRSCPKSEVPMTGIVARVYEDDQHYHMVFKNSSSTKGNSTDDEERQRTGIPTAAGGEFKLQKRDLYKERIEQEAIERASRLQRLHRQQNQKVSFNGQNMNQQNQDGHMSDQSEQQGHNEIHNFLQEVVDADPEEFVNLALALDLDEKEMEEQARMRLAEEGHLNLAVKQDEESIRLMKQALLLEKILSNYDESEQLFSAARMLKQFSQNERASIDGQSHEGAEQTRMN